VEPGTFGAQGKGRALEREIAALFEEHGYRVEANRVLEGRSGAPHEVDVLAEKGDALTRSRVLVECKARNGAIEKDVVAKVQLVLRDLVGLNHAIIVSLEGWTSGAEAAARECGIELWGPHELREHLGKLSLSRLQAPPASRPAEGWPARVTRQAAEPYIARQAGGFLRWREELVALGLLWMPWHLLQVACARDQAFRRTVTTRTWHLVDALRSELRSVHDGEPRAAAVDTGAGALPVRVAGRAVEAEIGQAFERWSEVTTEAARARHAARLEAFGIRLPVRSVVVERARPVYSPIWVGLFRRAGAERVVAVDATRGNLDLELGRTLTGDCALVRQALEATSPGA
jgi:hypothetical protein